MPQLLEQVAISMNQFVNFAIKAGPEQLTAVRTIKHQHEQPYTPPPDPYKRFREGVIRIHTRGDGKVALDELLAAQTDPKKVDDYPELVDGYKAFWGRRQLSWFRPPVGRWEFGSLAVNVRPELGLEINGERFVIKLYPNKPRELNARKARLITQLMRLAIQLPEDVSPAILDVRGGRLHRDAEPDRDQTTILRGQARSFVEMYRRL